MALKEFKTLFPYTKKHRNAYIAGISALLITDTCQLIVPMYIKKAIDSIKGPDSLNRVLLCCLIIVGLSVILTVGRIIWRNLILKASRTIETDLRLDLFKKFLALPEDFYKEYKTGDLMTRSTSDLENIRQAAGFGFAIAIDSVFMTLTALIVIFTMYPQMTLLTFVPLFLMGFTLIFVGKVIGDRFKIVQESYSSLNNFVKETLSGIKVIKGLTKEDYICSEFEKLNLNYKQKYKRLIIVWGALFPFVMLLGGLTTYILLRFGGVQVIKGTMTTGDFAAFLTYLNLLIWPLVGVGYVVNVIQRGAVSLKRVNEVMDKEPESASSLDNLTPEIHGGIEVRNLSWIYHDSEKAILTNINFKIDPGQTLGILGTTGSGKTTLLNMLPRLIQPPEGTVFVDGIDVRRIELEHLRKNISCVPQESLLFSDTIKQNIAFGLAENHPFSIDQADLMIRKVAECSTISAEYEAFPDGENTIIGERGTTVSGGQKQRIAIARALLSNSSILIFDDALASVDTRTEDRILNHFCLNREGKTNIIIAHRVSAIKNADLILVMDKGCIIQRGTHSSLLKEDGMYKDIYSIQQIETGESANG